MAFLRINPAEGRARHVLGDPLRRVTSAGGAAELEWTFVQDAVNTSGSGSSVPITLSQAVTPGTLLLFYCTWSANNVEMLSVDKGGTLVPIVGTSGGAGYADSSGPMGHIIAAEAATSPITVTFNGDTGGCIVGMIELAYTGGTPALDCANRFSNPSGASATGPAFTLSGGSSAIIHTSVQTANATAVSEPYASGYDAFPSGTGVGVALNVTDGAGAEWTYDGSSNAGLTGVAFGLNPDSFLTQAFCDFEGGSNGADCTAANLLASTRGWTAGRWRLGGTGAAMKFASAASKPLVNATGRLNDGGNYPAGAGSLGVRFLTSTVQSYIYLDYAASASAGTNARNSDSFSAGVWFRSDLPDDDLSNIDVFTLYAAGGTGFANCKFLIHPNGIQRSFELEIPGGSSGERIAVDTGQWYWLTLQYNESGSHKLRVYDASLTLVGELVEAHTGTGMPGNVQIGQTSSNTPTTGYSCDFDSLKVDPTGTFPLLP